MKIYIVIWEDRHCDVTAHPFIDKQKAIDWAKTNVKSVLRFPEDYKETDCSNIKDWVFSAEYSDEGDFIRVVETELES